MISHIEIVPINTRHDGTLVAFCRFMLHESFLIGDVALHWHNGRYYLLWPGKKLKSGSLIHYCKPANADIDQRILSALVQAYQQKITDGDSEVFYSEQIKEK